jgi:hypothetical protein
VIQGDDPSPQRLDKLPPWADPATADTELAKKRKEVLGEFRHLALTKSIGEALDELVNSDDPDRRRLAVFAMSRPKLQSLLGLSR